MCSTCFTASKSLFDELLDVDLDPETGTLRIDESTDVPAERLRRIVEMLLRVITDYGLRITFESGQVLRNP